MHVCACKVREPLFIIIMMVFLTAYRAEMTEDLQSCHVAQLQCHARSGCQMALNNFFIHCHSVIRGEHVNTCPTDCKHALVSLLSTEDETGLAFINCNCHREKTCAERKKRVEVCQREVLESMHVLQDNAPPVTCNLARWICEADTSCLAALQYYYDHCSRLFSGLRCTSRCRNSLEILSRQPHASKLRSCLCDGSEDYDCPALKVNTETLCFHRKGRRHKKHKNSSVESSSTELSDASGNSDGKNLSKRAGKRARRRKRRNRALNWKKAKREKRRKPRKRYARKRKRPRDERNTGKKSG